MKKQIFNPKNPDGIIEDFTAEEISQREKDIATGEADEQKRVDAIENQKNLKASAKAKLIAGEPLTEDEANTVVL